MIEVNIFDNIHIVKLLFFNMSKTFKRFTNTNLLSFDQNRFTRLSQISGRKLPVNIFPKDKIGSKEKDCKL